MNMDFFGMFDYANGDDATYEYTATEYAKVMQLIVGDGIVSGYGTAFGLSRTGRTCSLGAGAVFIQGYSGISTASKSVTLTAAASGMKRIDIIVARLNTQARTMALEVISGAETASTPSAPVLSQAASIYELPLYQLTVFGTDITATADRRQLKVSMSHISAGYGDPDVASLGIGDIYIKLQEE